MIATVRVIIKGSFRDSNDYFRNSSTWADIHLEANKAKREITRTGILEEDESRLRSCQIIGQFVLKDCIQNPLTFDKKERMERAQWVILGTNNFKECIFFRLE